MPEEAEKIVPFAIPARVSVHTRYTKAPYDHCKAKAKRQTAKASRKRNRAA